MSTGRWHNRINGLLALSVFGGALYVGAPLPVSAGLSVGVVIGFAVNPDLDVNGGSIAMHNIRRPFGTLAAGLWRVYWYLYARLIRHRSFWSHTPVVGTLLRVLYLAPLWICLIPFLSEYLLIIVTGLCLSDTIHWIMDIV
jgi:uncharacterized metal-binding protein